MYKFGTIVLVPFPFTDLTSTKLRPALIISKTANISEDLMVCFITSKVSTKISKNHFLLKRPHRDFQMTGLKVDSVFKFDKIATLNKKLFLGELGEISKTLSIEMKKSFQEAFGFFE